MTATRPNREREEILSIRLNADEKRMVQALADIDGLSLSDVARYQSSQPKKREEVDHGPPREPDPDMGP
jgi:hypothetical protein